VANDNTQRDSSDNSHKENVSSNYNCDNNSNNTKKKKSRKGKGKFGFDKYQDSPVNKIGSGYKSGQNCPCCARGKLYSGESRKLLNFYGSPALSVNRFEKEVMRCNACGREFMSHQRVDKWEDSAKASVILQRVSGTPYNRLSNIQGMCGVPVAASTLWHLVESTWDDVGRFIVNQLRLEMQQMSSLFAYDDTSAKILEIMARNNKLTEKERRACHTTVICGKTLDEERSVIYITKDQYAGENIADLLLDKENKMELIPISESTQIAINQVGIKLKDNKLWCVTYDDREVELIFVAKKNRKFNPVGGISFELHSKLKEMLSGYILWELAPGDRRELFDFIVLNDIVPSEEIFHEVITMVDGSSMNTPKLAIDKMIKFIVAYCLAHARAKFFDIKDDYPEICNHMLEKISAIYNNDCHCKSNNYNDEQRLKYHNEHSKLLLDAIYDKIDECFANKIVEPNSKMGKTMIYWQKRRDGLSKFLQISGVPIDNNLSERQLKKFVIQRKNSLFFFSLKSAEITNGFSSIVSTCALLGINAFDYLIWIQKNYSNLQKNPAAYLPSKYKKALNQTELIAA